MLVGCSQRLEDRETNGKIVLPNGKEMTDDNRGAVV
jgi:hypothetical protein